MPQLPAQALKQSWWGSFSTRMQRVLLAVKTPTSLPISFIQLSNGLVIDLSTKTLIVAGELSIHSTGTFRLSSDEHIILESGGGLDHNGQVQGVWLNPVVDHDGNPYEVPEEIEGVLVDGTEFSEAN